MNDDDLDLRIYARRGSATHRLVRPARGAAAAPGQPAPLPSPPVQAQTLPAAPVRTPPMSPARASAAERLDEGERAAPPEREAAEACAESEERAEPEAREAPTAPTAPIERVEPPRRVTQELPVVPRVAPPPAAAPVEPGRRITQELPVMPAAPALETILRILRAPPEWGETVKGAFTRKERELALVFEALEPAEASDLFRRLSNPQPDDPVAASFARLVPERRGRLLGFLVSARRRAELAQARRPPPQPRRKDE